MEVGNRVAPLSVDSRSLGRLPAIRHYVRELYAGDQRMQLGYRYGCLLSVGIAISGVAPALPSR